MGFSTDPTKGSCFMLMESMSNSLIRNMRMRKLVEAVLSGSGSAPPVYLFTKQILVLLLG